MGVKWVSWSGYGPPEGIIKGKTRDDGIEVLETVYNWDDVSPDCEVISKTEYFDDDKDWKLVEKGKGHFEDVRFIGRDGDYEYGEVFVYEE